ncbi:hypothetical protein [Pedobacter steynii]
MTFKDHLDSIFVAESEIPEEFRLTDEVHQREYLSNGKMHSWSGEVHEVLSPICIKTPGGLKRKVIGTYPLCNEAEAAEALKAAVTAYNNGRGEWPTMSVADRITCVEKFTHRIIEKRTK